MGSQTAAGTSAQEILAELLLLAKTESEHERRSAMRYPFFRPAVLEFDNHNFSAFTREVSSAGVGLLHCMKVPIAEIGLSIAGRPGRLRIRIQRCEAIGEGWYISGGELIGQTD